MTRITRYSNRRHRTILRRWPHAASAELDGQMGKLEAYLRLNVTV